MHQSEVKWEKPHFWGDKGGLKGIKGLIQKSAWNILSPIHVLSNCQVSEKSNEWFPRWRVTDIRIYGGTNYGDSKGPSTDGGETNNQTIPMTQSEEKCENLIFKPF